MSKVLWLDEPEEHDYPAAKSFLSLICEPIIVEQLLAKFRSAAVTQFKAKDIIRASQLARITNQNFNVDQDLKKIENGKSLSPILLIRGGGKLGTPLIIADGYHRACAVYWNNEDDLIYAKIIDWN